MKKPSWKSVQQVKKMQDRRPNTHAELFLGESGQQFNISCLDFGTMVGKSSAPKTNPPQIASKIRVLLKHAYFS